MFNISMFKEVPHYQEWRTIQPIRFDSEAEMTKFLEFIQSLRVSPTDFNPVLVDEDDEGETTANPIHCEYNYEKLEVMLSATGGFEVAKMIPDAHGFMCLSKPLGNILDNGCFDEEFASKNPSFLIQHKTQDADGQEIENMIALGVYHSDQFKLTELTKQKNALTHNLRELQQLKDKIQEELDLCDTRLSKLSICYTGDGLPF